MKGDRLFAILKTAVAMSFTDNIYHRGELQREKEYKNPNSFINYNFHCLYAFYLKLQIK